jgi:nucleotide sugar dehydrogenase
LKRYETVIVGKGIVGTATGKIFNDWVDFHDPQKGLIINDFSQYCYAIICVPTPGIVGGLNYSYLEDSIVNLERNNFKGTIVIRSTCDPYWLTEVLPEFYSNTIYWPEFLRERIANYDATHPHVVVLGGESKSLEWFSNYLRNKKHGYTASWTLTDITSASIIKLSLNSALAAKIAMFNSINQICDSFGVDYKTVRDAVARDPRIGFGQTDVPGPDGNFGFGGKCLPKDLNSFAKMAKDNVFIDALRAYNKSIRK